MATAKIQLDGFLDKFEPAVAKDARGALAKLRKLVPGALELVYDNYNALAIGFGPTEKASDIAMSIAVYPRWVSIFFMNGPQLPDPEGLLRGGGTRVRHIQLASPATLDAAPVRALIKACLASIRIAIDPRAKSRIVIKSISGKQRPRRLAQQPSSASRTAPRSRTRA
jgi:hypothetical protein